jgi:hypothetical protein
MTFSLSSKYEPQWNRVMTILNEMDEFQRLKDILPIIGSYLRRGQRLLFRYRTGKKTLNHFGHLIDLSLMAVTITPPTTMSTTTTTGVMKQVKCKIVDNWIHNYNNDINAKPSQLMEDYMCYSIMGPLSINKCPCFVTWNMNTNEVTCEDAPQLQGYTHGGSIIIDHHVIWFGKSNKNNLLIFRFFFISNLILPPPPLHHSRCLMSLLLR